jgi:ABC-type transporter Mla maintaining outer membrane lipid asymmetry ATPase subunit MlaF
VADRIAIINEGKILFIGTVAEVKQHSDPLIKKFIHADLTQTKT